MNSNTPPRVSLVLSPKVGDYIEGPSTVWEKEPMANLARDGQLSVYLHDGFWHPMDTLRDKEFLAEANAQQFEINIVEPGEIVAYVEKAYTLKPEAIAKIRKAQGLD